MGPQRFEIRRVLGEGGMGVVYEARDTARDMMVALKTLRIQDANLLYHFKNEFRAVADLSHPNLIQLHELFEADGQWFFTMELIEGCDFGAWIRPQAAAPPALGSGEASTLLEFATPRPTTGGHGGGAGAAAWLPYDEDRLRDALAQLASGLAALHAAGKVHRDVKPNNILVTPAGRVVIMDFGLVADAARLAELAAVGSIAGTPTFMAPEQGIPGASVGAAADWYAVGVMLYQILTSRLPFAGDTVQALIAAKHTPPPAPGELAPGVPADLAALCVRLLAPRADDRPSGDEVVRLLGGKRVARATDDVFVGRRAELGQLHAALAESRRRAVSVFVEGVSGLGKTAVVRRFLDELRGTGTLILEGRCYAEETVPYKAFDGVVDALSRHLVTMDRDDARAVIPPGAGLLGRLFPVLRRVRGFAQEDLDAASGLELRARAFAALGELLERLARSRPVVVFVDDLQWADADSVLLLRELLHPEIAPPIAFVATLRTDADTARLAALAPRTIRLEPLAPDDAAMLVDHLLARDAVSRERRDEIAREAAGHPLFLAELAHHLADHGDHRPTARLDDALWERVQGLADEPRHLLHVIAVAGTPIDQRTAADASGLPPARCASHLAALRAARLVKTAVAADSAAIVEPYHDRVRESVVARLDRVTLSAISGRLAHAMLRAGLGETAPEVLVRHLFAAGDTALGRGLAERAARRALDALAFDRAAELLRVAIDAGPRDAAHASALHLARAEALASGGRGAEAADAFLAAGHDRDDETRLDCQRHAADQLLASGHVERGLAELAGVLDRLGAQLPATPDAALAALQVERAALDREAATPPPLGPAADRHVLRALDVYQSTSIGLLLVDNVRGAYCQARASRLAATAGDPRRLVRALVFEAIYRAQEGELGRRRALELIAAADEVARGRGDPWLDAYLVLVRAFSAYYHGRFRRAVELFVDADARFRVLPGVAWEQNTIKLHRLRATDYQGAWGELRALYDGYLRDAQRRDDRYVEASLTRWFNVLWLAHDKPDLAGADLDKRVWTPPDEGRYHLQHFLELRARVELALYRGDGAAQGGWARPGLAAAERSLLLRIQIARAIADWLLGRIAACEGDVAEIEHRARLLDDQRINYASIWGGLLAAAALAQRGDRRAAIVQLETTAAIADANDFPLCATIARYRSAELAGAADRRTAAAAWMTGQDIRNPARICEVFAPGFG